MTLGENLQNLRKEAGLSQEQVAQQLFVSRQTVSKWENNLAEPGVENLKALAGLYGVTLDRLVGMEPPPPLQSSTYSLPTRSGKCKAPGRPGAKKRICNRFQIMRWSGWRVKTIQIICQRKRQYFVQKFNRNVRNIMI